jgi:flagellar L-ring protein precursor FlgH
MSAMMIAVEKRHPRPATARARRDTRPLGRSTGYRGILSLLLACAMFTGCGSAPQVEESLPPTMVMQQDYPEATSGAIYRAGTEVRLFEDLKAGRVGDILTVRLAERTDASKASSTSTSKSSSASLENPVVLGRPVTRDGVAILDGSIGGDRSFDGEGSSSQSNSLEGDITVTVVERLPNGNLRISGEKWLTINQGKEFIRLTGIIRPYDIEPDNSVFSNRIADAHIAYSSKGVLAAANRMGWLSRFFQSAIYPF